MENVKVVTDQLGREVHISSQPKKIVSLVPSQTELLFSLGLAEHVVGITKFCIHPQELTAGIQKIGGTKRPDLKAIAKLEPDLIIANKEENREKDIRQLEALCPVWVSDVSNVEQAIEMIEQIGEITSTDSAADALVNQIQVQFGILSCDNNIGAPRTAYFIWKSPYMAVGGDTFIDHMLEIAGFQNCFGGLKRYPSLTVEEIAKAMPELILLSSEPYSFNEEHRAEFREICPKAKVVLVDGEIFSWYGSRMLMAPHYFRKLRAQLELR